MKIFMSKKGTFTFILIALLCITMFASAVTWTQVISAINAVRNAIALYNKLKGSIPTLDEQVTNLQLSVDSENEDYFDAVLELASAAAILASHEGNLAMAESAYAAAKLATSNAESAVSTAQNLYDVDKEDSDRARSAYYDHVKNCDECYVSIWETSLCYDGTMYRQDWLNAHSDMQTSKKALKAAKKELSKRKNEELAAKRSVSEWTGNVQNMTIWVNSRAKKVKELGDVLKILRGQLKTKSEELEAETRRRDALRVEIPILQAHMDQMIAAWSEDNPDFNWTEYFEQNPIPEIDLDED